MSVEQMPPAIVPSPAEIAIEREPSTPRWLLLTLGGAYLVALAVLVFAPGGTLLDRLRALDGGICAQLPGHSFFPAGEQLPLCARNTGIYLGFSSTVIYLWSQGRLRAARLPSPAILIALGLAVALMAFDGFNSFFLDLRLPHLYTPNNLLRLATGLGAGTAMAAIAIPVTNGLIWREDDIQRTFSSFKAVSVMLPILLLAFLAVASPQNGALLYPIALLSTAGLILALTSVNVVFMLGVSNRIGRFSTWRSVFPLISLAVGCAIVELMALFMLKTFVMSALGA
jgi:uncharacterized membrane protein